MCSIKLRDGSKKQMTNFRLEENLVESLDKLADSKGYPSRSELVRDIFRQVIKNHKGEIE